jgi:hypothetical protein
VNGLSTPGLARLLTIAGLVLAGPVSIGQSTFLLWKEGLVSERQSMFDAA